MAGIVIESPRKGKAVEGAQAGRPGHLATVPPRAQARGRRAALPRPPDRQDDRARGSNPYTGVGVGQERRSTPGEAQGRKLRRGR